MPAKSRTIGCIQLWEASMRLMGLGLVSMTTLVVALFAGAQDRGARGGQRGGAGTPAMTMTIAGFPDGGRFPVKFSQAAEGVAPGEGRSPAISWVNAPAGIQVSFTCMTWISPTTGQRMIRFTGWCGIFRPPPPAWPKALRKDLN